MELSPAGEAILPETVRNEITYLSLSEAPQAEPQAAGFCSGLSPAPQAEPQAAGFSSDLSPTPQAEPQADVTDVSFQPIKFESAIF